MLIAQITDIHLGFDPGNPNELNRWRLDQVLSALCETTPRPDLLLATGGLTEYGDDELSYPRLREALSGLPFPAFLALGNHDDRAAFRRHFPDVPVADGFIQYAVEDYPLRILVLDTLENGRHVGGFCETRAAWLRDRLAEAPARPTLVVLHHPPIESGLSWMTENPDAAWVRRLHAVISGQRNIVAMVSGHIHRPIFTQWAGTRLIVCPSTAPEVPLDLDTMDPEEPDGRPLIVIGPPSFALHRWTGSELLSYFDSAENHDVLASFTTDMQPLIRRLANERKGS